MMENKQHLTKRPQPVWVGPLGLNKILFLKSALNKGLTEQIKSNFPNVKSLVRPEYKVSDKA
jgi:hypothetical protein